MKGIAPGWPVCLAYILYCIHKIQCKHVQYRLVVSVFLQCDTAVYAIHGKPKVVLHLYSKSNEWVWPIFMILKVTLFWYMVFVMREYSFLKNKVCLYFLWTTGSFFATYAQYTTCFWVAHVYLEIIHFLLNPPLSKCLCNFDIILIIFYYLTNGCPQPIKINVTQRVGTITFYLIFFTQINSWNIIHKHFTDERSSGDFLTTFNETQKINLLKLSKDILVDWISGHIQCSVHINVRPCMTDSLWGLICLECGSRLSP